MAERQPVAPDRASRWWQAWPRVSVWLALGAMLGSGASYWWTSHAVLSPTIAVTLTETGQVFTARLDTGAVVSSINATDIKVLGSDELPSVRDTGKLISFVLINDLGERRQLTARVAQVRGIRSADCREVRYHVYLTVRFRGHDYRILTNLNDRSGAGDKLLLGRNWLRYGFAVATQAEADL